MIRLEAFVNINNTWQSLKGTANLVNLTVSELLDEALDEARAVIKNSNTKNYAPLTEVRIDYYEDNALVDSDYLLVAEPKADEYPIKKD